MFKIFEDGIEDDVSIMWCENKGGGYSKHS